MVAEHVAQEGRQTHRALGVRLRRAELEVPAAQLLDGLI
jgi:hypothetical protein